MCRPTGALSLLAGNKISGPALIEEHASTTVLMPGDKMTVDAYGNLVIAVGGVMRNDDGQEDHAKKPQRRNPARSIR